MGSVPNPNWPLVTVNADFTQGPPATPGAYAQSLNNPANRNAVRDLEIVRGRQYELDQIQAGTAAITITDPLEYLHPRNAASPFNQNGNTITSYRCVQIAALWNAATASTAGNILNASNTVPGAATAYDPSFESGVGWLNKDGSSAGLAQSSTNAYAGTHSLALTLSEFPDFVTSLMWTAPGVTYTFSVYVYIPSGSSIVIAVGGHTTEHHEFGHVYGTMTSTVTGAWQRLSLTATATDAVSYFSVKGAPGTTYPFTAYLDAIQLEIGAQASAFTTAGPTIFPLYTGYIERYPLQWDMGGTRGIRPLTCVDALSVLARTEITQAYATTVLADKPYLYMPLNDQSVPQAVQLPQGGAGFLGYTSLGSEGGSVNFQGDTTPDGSSAVSVVQQNTNPVDTDGRRTTYLGTLGGPVVCNPGWFSLEMWIKITAGVVYLGAASGTDQSPDGPQHYIGIYTSAGQIISHFTDPNGGSGNAYDFPGLSGYPDGQWHYLAIVLPGSGQIQLTADGSQGGYGQLGFNTSQAISLNNFFVEATTAYGDPVTDIAIANIAAYPFALSGRQLAAHYNRGAGYLAEASGTRAARLLSQYWGGSMQVAPGKRQMAPDFNYSTRFLLDVCQEIQETERGLIYADRRGVVLFEDSTSRYLTGATSTAVFGENPPSANPVEYPYSALVLDVDPTYTFSQTSLTRPGNDTYPPQINPTAALNYGQRILTQEVEVNTDFDLSQASTFYLTRYATPQMRVETLTLNPAANPAMFAVVLGLEISQRITVTRRSSSGLVTTADYYVEQINHKIDSESSTWTVDLQCSPVFTSSAWVLGDPTYGVLGISTVPVY